VIVLVGVGVWYRPLTILRRVRFGSE